MTDETRKPDDQKALKAILKEAAAPKPGAGKPGRTHFQTLRDGTETSESKGNTALPRQFGEWIVDEEMVGGAQAYVYRVHREGDDAKYVLKLLRPWTEKSKQDNETEQRRRFIGEVSTLETLRLVDCPRIAEIVESSLNLKSGEQPWFVMPFYEGGAMRKSAADGEPGDFAEVYKGNVDRVLSIGADLAETVAAMHSTSPLHVHRDIHTQNIFFETTGGPPILGDFGLAAKGKSPANAGTRLPEAFGPWRWRPPEMRPGSDNKREAGSDVYLIGGVIYEALTGGQHIEETQQLDGEFTHEKGEYRLGNFCDDPRVPMIERMLRMCFVRDPDFRVSASELHRACEVIQNWKPGSPQPNIESRHKHMEKVAKRAAAASKQTWNMGHRDDLNRLLQGVVDEVSVIREEVSRKRDPNQFYTDLRMNSLPGEIESGFKKLTGKTFPEAAGACITGFVGFSPEPAVEFSAGVIVWRDKEHEHVGVAGKGVEPRLLGSSFHNDPEHVILIRSALIEQIERLQKRAVRDVENYLNSLDK